MIFEEQPETKDWEKELDELDMDDGRFPFLDKDEVKRFIRSLLASQREELIEEIKEYIEKRIIARKVLENQDLFISAKDLLDFLKQKGK